MTQYTSLSYGLESHFKFVHGAFEDLSLYQTSKKILEHYFCPDCGVAFVTRGFGAVAVNVRTIEGIRLENLKLKVLDWESQP